MSLSMCVLGSGSSGNATVVRTSQGAILIDAGFGPRTTAQRLHGTGVALEDITAICLTHLDSDHFNPNWYQTIVKQRIAVHCHASKAKKILASPEARDLKLSTRLQRANPAPLESLIHPFENDTSFEPIPGLTVSPFPLAHDESGSHGFIAESAGHRLGFATDLGRVPDDLIDLFAGTHMIALESNYDHEMEVNSTRPWYLKERIMGGHGHLSNDEAFAAIRAVLDHCQRHARDLPAHIVLLHRSRECNCPKLLKRLFASDKRIAPRLTLTHQHERTRWLTTRAAEPMIGEQMQLSLEWR